MLCWSLSFPRSGGVGFVVGWWIALMLRVWDSYLYVGF